MSSKLFIRHSYKAYKNGASTVYPLDPYLTVDGEVAAENKIVEFIREKKFPLPDKIVSSPFRRARETAEITQKMIFILTSIFIPIEIDLNIREIITKRFAGYSFDESFSEVTKYYLQYVEDSENCAAINNQLYQTETRRLVSFEDSKDFQARIRSFIEHRKGQNIWIISHGSVITEIGHQLGYSMDYPAELKGFKMEKGKIELL
jgi:broad specificity phosphatase PhoE